MGASTHRITWQVNGDNVINYPSNADFTTDSKKFELSYEFCIQAILSSLTGTPTLTLEASNDNINFVVYNPDAKDIDLTNTDNQIIYDDKFPCLYLRLKYVANGNNGTISFIDIRKRGN